MNARIASPILVAATCLVAARPALAGGITPNGTQPIVSHDVYHSSQCLICHGFDYDPKHLIEPYDTWAGTMMAQSARDPLFWAALDVANHDQPGVGEFCLRCHAPGAWLAGRAAPPTGSVDGCSLQGTIDGSFAEDFDGVTCHLCHRMMVNPAPPPGQQPFYLENAQYWIDDSDCDGQGEPCRRGPYEYQGFPHDSPPPHPYQYSPYHEQSNLCGTCHNVTSPTKTLIVNGVDLGIGFPIERTHREWEQSAYGPAGTSETTCQGCHMPDVDFDPVYACLFADNNRTGDMGLHSVVGGNTWIPEVIKAAYPALGRDDALDSIRDAALDMLQHRSASLTLSAPGAVVPGSPLPVAVKITNLTGHKLPTGYAEGRRMWLHVTAKDGAQNPIFESGAYSPLTGVLTHDPALKLYRADQGIWNLHGSASCDTTDLTSRPIFHFTLNDCIAIDNRIPPLGFRGGADPAIGPVGYTYPETAPGSGVLVNHDVTYYSIPIPPGAVSPISVSAELRYQTTSKEYVEFVRDEAVANNFPDDCISRSGGPAGQSRGELLYDLWTQNGRSTPVTMGTDGATTALVANVGPGEASRSVTMRVTAFDRLTGDVTVSYQPACGASDHTIYVGSLSGLPSMTFTQAFCGRGTSGATTFRPVGNSLFWVIVGTDGAEEGSYGRSSQGAERPQSAGLAGCDVPQNLADPCLP